MKETFSKKTEHKSYRYFLCDKDSKRIKSTCPVKRIPAAELEKLLLNDIALMLEDGTVKTVTELARQEKTERAFLFHSLSTVNLAPDIVEMILNGTEPKTLTMGKLRKGFPDDWEEQRKLFGI